MPDIYQFGRLTLMPRRRALLADGEPVVLTARAFDMLDLLVRCRDRVLTREEIVAHVWQGLAVGENNLTVQMSTLRRVLQEYSDGAQLIATVPGRGYQFIGEVVTQRSPPPVIAPSPAAASSGPPDPVPSAAEPPPVIRRPPAVPRLVVGVAVLLLIVLIVGAVLRVQQSGPPRLSLAVLPFHDLSQGHAQDYLADALTDDLTTDLSHLPGSVVIGRESAASFTGRTLSTRQIGSRLNVRYLVTGSLRVDEAGYHINAELIDAASGAHLWDDRFDVPRAGVGAAQDVMVRRMATALDFQLGQLVSARSLKDRPNDPDALDLFFRARAIGDRDDSLQGLQQAQDLLEQALAQRPDFGDALAELGLVLLRKVNEQDDPHDAEDYAEAKRVIAKALKLSPLNAEALGDQARAYMIEGKWTDAEYSARAALAIEPSNVTALGVLASCAQAQGHLTEAVPYLDKIFQLLPDSPANKPRYATLGYIRLLQGHTDEALDLLHRAIAGDADPKPGDETMGRAEFVRLMIVAATWLRGDEAGARALYQAARAVWPDRSVWRVGGYLPKAAQGLPGYHRVLDALHQAGMPAVAGERDGATSMDAGCVGDDFARSPPALPGGETLSTRDLIARLAAPTRPIVIDTGRGQAALPGAIMFVADSAAGSLHAFLDRVVAGRTGMDRIAPVVVMGDGPFGCAAYDAASYLMSKGDSQVAWYRGGEEAWAAAGQKSIDLRP